MISYQQASENVFITIVPEDSPRPGNKCLEVALYFFTFLVALTITVLQTLALVTLFYGALNIGNICDSILTIWMTVQGSLHIVYWLKLFVYYRLCISPDRDQETIFPARTLELPLAAPRHALHLSWYLLFVLYNLIRTGAWTVGIYILTSYPCQDEKYMNTISAFSLLSTGIEILATYFITISTFRNRINV